MILVLLALLASCLIHSGQNFLFESASSVDSIPHISRLNSISVWNPREPTCYGKAVATVEVLLLLVNFLQRVLKTI